MTRVALVLHSGGMDSTVCLFLAKEAGRDVISLGIDHGQQQGIELHYARAIAERMGLRRIELEVRWDKPNLPSLKNRSIDEIRGSLSPAILPGRNVLFLSLACAEAAGIEASEVWIGVNAIDYSGYLDCRPEFIEAFQRMIGLAMPHAPRIVAPLLDWTKPRIAAEAARFGLDCRSTWSCYAPRQGDNAVVPCGECDACILNEYAWSLSEHK